MAVLNIPMTLEIQRHWISSTVFRQSVNGIAKVGSSIKAIANAGSWEPAVTKLISFQQVEDDWDGFGAKAPGSELLESAIGLAHIFSQKGIDPPNGVMHGVTGTVIFEWQFKDGTYAEVEIDRPLHAEVMLVEPGKPAQHWTLPTE
jgi:hypothetical protein